MVEYLDAPRYIPATAALLTDWWGPVERRQHGRNIRLTVARRRTSR